MTTSISTATATLTLPCSAIPNRFKRDYIFDHSQFNQPYRKTYVLSADDEPLVLVTRRAILEISGYEVLNATNGPEALAIFGTHHVDLAILDYRMPVLDGGAVARELKRMRPLLPVIMISGGYIDEATRACADCFLTKGQSPALLLGEMERLLAASEACVRAAQGC